MLEAGQTVESIRELVAQSTTRDNILETCIIMVFEKQTACEQMTATTSHLNGVGFSGFDAKTGTNLANWAIAGKPFRAQWARDKARKLAHKYAKQIAKIANGEL